MASLRKIAPFRLVLATLSLLFLACEDSTEPPPPPTLCESQTQIPTVECEALVAFYEATNGPGWTNSDGWLENELPCEWHGVTCADGVVERLTLGPNQLAGPLPPELGNLTGLVALDLNNNALTGPIPPELDNLTRLELLALPANDLTGPIPPELRSLESLVFLYLWSNELTGSIPPELAELPNLSRLILRRNQLTGTIPPELGAMPALRWLMLNDNQLTGTIPAALGGLQDLEVLWLHDNDLEGALPVEVAELGAAIQQATTPDDCTLQPGTDDLHIPDQEAYRDTDLDGDGLICGMAVPEG